MFPELSDVSRHLEDIPSFPFLAFKYAPPLVDCGLKLASWASDADDASLKDTLLATWDRVSSQELDATVPAVEDDPLEDQLRKMTAVFAARVLCMLPAGSQRASHGELIQRGHSPLLQ